MHQDGSLNPAPIPAYVDALIQSGIRGLFVAGTTGEGASLTVAERCELAEAFVGAAAGRIPVVIHVGHNSAREARGLAGHAQAVGADAISAFCPSYFKPPSVPILVEVLADLAEGAPDLPFYYYHIPSFTGVRLDLVTFLEAAPSRIPTLAGIKYSDPFVPEYQACVEFDDRRFDLLWGCDEMLLSGLVVGAKGAVGSTYNVAAALYLEIMERFRSGDLEGARASMHRAVQMVRLLGRTASVTTAIKEVVMPLQGFDFGRSRPPLPSISPDVARDVKEAWIRLAINPST